jgi:glycosyltransferase involved in cell wall biosynthesis
MNYIPNIIHQLWIGPKPAPTKLMDTWKDKNPNFTYIRWNEDEILKRNLKITCQHRIDEMIEINGKADIIRWEILYEYGGIFLDADSICIEPIDDILMNKKCFAGWEQEQLREGLIATGTMGFPPKHPLVKGAIEWIQHNCVDFYKNGLQAWKTVGPGLLTMMYDTGLYNDLTIFPSYYFLPIHHTGVEYTGHGKIYAYQEWGSTHQSYDTMNNIFLPAQFLQSSITESVSILVSSYNTKTKYIQDCLESIKHQQGYFNIELVWINDGSDELNTKLLKKCLENFEKTTRFVKVIYEENDMNRGVGYTLNKGVNTCNNEIIIRMDSDDIMVSNRIDIQLKFMKNNINCVMLGSNIQYFQTNEKNEKIMSQQTNHPELLTWEQYKQYPNKWFMNHPTLCFKKTDVLSVGNYNINRCPCEDFELELKILKKYGIIHNISDVLLYYRIHSEQITYNGSSSTPEWNTRKNKFIENMINDYNDNQNYNEIYI